MLTNAKIKRLSYCLKEDIRTLNLTPEDIPDRANHYLENIAGLEFLSPAEHQKLIQQIVDGAKVTSAQIF